MNTTIIYNNKPKAIETSYGTIQQMFLFFEVVGHWQRGVRRFDPSKQNQYK